MRLCLSSFPYSYFVPVIYKTMRLQKLTKKQIKEALDQTPMHEILLTDKSNLTNKQIEFCKNLATGETKANAYRKAYKSKGNSHTVADKGYKMAKRADIQTMTEAIKQGIEFQKLYTAGQIRALVVQRLTQEAISEDSNPSVRVNALKALGTIAGVDAFIHRTETKVIKDSDKAKEDLLQLIKDSLAMKTIDQSDDDVNELLNEINGLATPPEILPAISDDPHGPLIEVGVPIDNLHSIPHIQSPSETNSEVIQNNIEDNQ
jgi:hypothetical protein